MNEETIKFEPDYLYDVFISYARKDDKEFVGRLYEDLTKAGFKVWWDIECMPSRDLTFLQEIRDAIDDSRRLLAVVGPKAVESDYVIQEWIWASQFGNGILPILRKGDYDLLDAPKTQGLITNRHCPDFTSDDKDNYAMHFAELCRILTQPMKPKAILYKVPALPPHFQYRKNDLNALLQAVLADVRKPILRKSAPRPLVIHGMGGIGKSVLASALAWTMETRRLFMNGIFWVTIGQKPDILESILSIGSVFNEDISIYNDLNDAQIHLTKDLHDKKALIILDDVWEVSHVEPFLNAMGSHCRLLLTTRDRSLATALEAQEHPLGTLNEEDAIQFLAEWVDMDKGSLPQIALNVIEECGKHTFALALAGVMYKEGTPWKDMYEALRETDLQFLKKRFPNYLHTDVFRMIKVGVDLFKARNPKKAKFYDELVVFRPEIIPEHAVMVLWTRSNELKERDARQLLITLNNQSLLHLEGRPPNSLISLHDLLYDFLCASINDLTKLRKALLLAYKDKCPKGWHTGPNDGYFFQHIGFILMKLNYWEELVNTLTDLKYIETCSKNGLLHILIKNYIDILASDDLPEVYRKMIQEFKLFAINQAHILRKYPHLTVQQAINQPDRTLPSQAGKSFIEITDLSQPWIEWVNKPQERDPWIFTFTGPVNNCMNGCAFSPDGSKILSASTDNTLKLWDVETGVEIRTFTGHSDFVEKCAFSPDGTKIVSASWDKTLKLWDVETGAEIRTFIGHIGYVRDCAFSPDGKKLISAGPKNIKKKIISGVILWDAETGTEMRSFIGHSGLVWGCTFSPDGSKIVSASIDDTLKLWDVKNGTEIRTFTGHSDGVRGCAFSPDGTKIVSASWDRTLKLWDVETGAEIRTFTGHSRWVTGCTFSPDGTKVVSASNDNTLKLWDVETGAEIKTFRGHSSDVDDCAFSPDGTKIISASSDNTLKLWDVEISAEVRTFTGHSHWVSGCAFSPDGKSLVSASWDNTLKLWDVESAAEVKTFRGHSSMVMDCAFSPNGTKILSATHKTVKFWDVKTGAGIRTFTKRSLWLDVFAFSPDGKTVVSTSMRKIRLWDIMRGKSIKAFKRRHSDLIEGFAFSPDGSKFITASRDKKLKLWDVKTGAELRTFIGHSDWVNGCAFSPDGSKIISASRDRTLKLWDVKTGAELRTFIGHSGEVIECAFLYNGKNVVSTSKDNTLKIWEASKGTELMTFPTLGSIYCIAVGINDLIACGDVGGWVYILRPHGLTNK